VAIEPQKFSAAVTWMTFELPALLEPADAVFAEDAVEHALVAVRAATAAAPRTTLRGLRRDWAVLMAGYSSHTCRPYPMGRVRRRWTPSP
jgi:hypothetical protein